MCLAQLWRVPGGSPRLCRHLPAPDTKTTQEATCARGRHDAMLTGFTPHTLADSAGSAGRRANALRARTWTGPCSS